MSVDTVLNFARDTRPADQYLYLLLDPLSACDEANPLHINSLAKRLGDAAVQRVPRPDLSHASEAFPVLITLAEPEDRPDEELLTRSHAYAADDRGYRKPYVCGWLTSRLPPEALAAHLVSFCQFSSQPDMEEFFPVFEPLRLELLASAARSEFASRLSPISHWLCPTSWGDFAVLTESRDTPATPLPALAFDVQREAPLVAAVLAAWKRSTVAPMDYAPHRWRSPVSMLPPQAAAHAYRLIRDARKFGLRDSHDIIMLALVRVSVHPHVPYDPGVQADIKRAARGESSLSVLLEQYDDRAWMRIVASLPPAKEYS